jgi:L-amino acid N-acyltransferase YncA
MDWIEERLREAGTQGAFWIDVTGRTMAPLVGPGDAVRVQACTAEALRAGDLALVRLGTVWAVRAVAGTRPLRTAPLWGIASPEEGTVHGRVVELRRGGRRVPLGGATRVLLTGARVARRALGRARDAARDATLPLTRPIRAPRFGEVRVRRVGLGDEAELDRFCRAHLPNARELVLRQLRGRWATEGVPMAAFDRRGRMRAFMFADSYEAEGVPLPGRWLRTLAVDPVARRLGLARRLALALCDEAARAGWPSLLADIVATNRASLALFRGLGFADAPPGVEEEANRVFLAYGRPRVRVLQRALVTPARAEGSG